jgi:hypothetical protein
MTSASPDPRTLTRMTGILTPRYVSARGKAFDLLLAGGLGLLFGFFSLAQQHFSGILGLAMLGPLIWRRTHPELVFFAVSAIAVLQWRAGVPLMAGNIG